jgi:KDO2-lipid IV(A) lauroyltransferase
MEVADIFGPDDWKGQPDPLFYITARYRWAIERMVRRNPDQYFWMHKIWRSRPRHERLNRPFPPKLREKLGSLPWLSDEDVGRIVEQSRIDGETLARTGKEKFD